MKLQNSVLALSAVAAMLLASGCSDDSSSKGSYSEAAVKSIVAYVYDDMGKKVVDWNETNTYDADKRLIGYLYKGYSREYVDYDHDNNGTDGNATTPDILASNYKLRTSDCAITTNDDGRKLTEVCTTVEKFSINGGTEKEWNELSDYDKGEVGANPNSKKELTYSYDDNGNIVEKTRKYTYWNLEGNETRKLIDGSYVYGDTNSSIPDYVMFKETYTYDTFSENEKGEDKIRQTIVTLFDDRGRLDADNNIVPTWDGVPEQFYIKTYAFKYNEINKIDAIAYDAVATQVMYEGTDGNLYRAASVSHADTLFTYDEAEQLEYINWDSSDITDSSQLLYNEDGRVVSMTELIPDFNNEKLNNLILNDSMVEVKYDGDQVSQVLFDNSSHIDITYEEFDNSVYDFNPMEWFWLMPTEPGVEGYSVYSSGI